MHDSYVLVKQRTPKQVNVDTRSRDEVSQRSKEDEPIKPQIRDNKKSKTKVLG